jgi:hypothetical protein
MEFLWPVKSHHDTYPKQSSCVKPNRPPLFIYSRALVFAPPLWLLFDFEYDDTKIEIKTTYDAERTMGGF